MFSNLSGIVSVWGGHAENWESCYNQTFQNMSFWLVIYDKL